MFTWDDGTQETSIRVSLHGAKALGETFENLGYEREKGSIKIMQGKATGNWAWTPAE